MVRFVASCILALAAASTALAARLPNGIYRVVYYPGHPEIDIPVFHFLTLDTPRGEATFNPTRLTDDRTKTQLVCPVLIS